MLERLFADTYMLHGGCYLWERDILALNVFSDALIGVSYLLISAVLVLLDRLLNFRQTWRYTHSLAVGFVATCGLTHFMDIVTTLWWPIYRAEAWLKLLTAGLAVPTIAFYLLTYVRLARGEQAPKDVPS